jgi:hypothetical protein
MQSQASSGGRGGTGLGTSVYRLPLSHYRRGGGGGSGALGSVGGEGGGVLRILARGEISNTGTIVAAGAAPTEDRTGTRPGSGGGGGGGGIVVLASGTSAASTGTIDVRGGNGGGPDSLGASGGGGGGGLVIFAAPQIGSLGMTLTGAGAALVPSGQLTTLVNPAQTWCGGGGGGACVGDGGGGYGVSGTGVLDGILNPQGQPVPAPVAAGAGQVVTFTSDPRTIW